ncbi:MAG: hypothetical protein M9938_01220 [Solirubrobacterales bacterium]|nr:hypothetical protein [Solirubrobacterales bacterium]
MPTKHPRHAITETPKLKEILDQLRDETGSVRLDWGELVILGAREKLRKLRGNQEDGDRILEEMADRICRGEGSWDVEAADEVKRKGLIEL